MAEPEFLDDDRFADPRSRFLSSALLYRRMADLTPRFTTADLMERLTAANIPAQPVRDLDDMLGDEHLAATGFFRRRSHPSEGDYYELQPPVKFSDATTVPDLMPPNLNQHGDAIRHELAANAPMTEPPA